MSEDQNRRWVIGASRQCDIVVDRPTVSARHCRLERAGSRFHLVDLESSNGTYVNGERITQRVEVRPGDRITLGRKTPMPWPAEAANVERDISRMQRLPVRELVTIGHAAKADAPRKDAPDEYVTIGRHPDCDHRLDDLNVSRRHARLRRRGESLWIEDLGSTNGTFVDGRRIKGLIPIRPGDTITIAGFLFTVTADGTLESRDFRGKVAIEAKQLVVEVPGKRLLDDVSLTIYPGEFVGLMGPSGAGKTTLLSALNGYLPPVDGEVRYNDVDLYSSYKQFQGILGYVPQDDIMHGSLTVRQALYYTARLRLPTDTSDAEIDERIARVIEQLELVGTEDVLIGSPEKKGISGGQRKRVNLAMELLTDPSVLLLDEPTSGLSSEDALVVMRLLRGMADEGKSIIMTIHQPSLEVYRLLDNLVLLGKDAGSPEPGRLVYYGPAYPEAITFFNADLRADSSEDLSPDHVLRGLGKASAAQWKDQYDASPLKREYVEVRASRATPSRGVESEARDHPLAGCGQTLTLMRRAVAIKLKDTTNTAILMLQAPVIAVLLVMVFRKQMVQEITNETWGAVANATSTTIFLMTLAALWFGCSNSAREIVGEWAVYRRERMVNLRIWSYVASKLAVLGGLCVVQCLILFSIVYFGVSLSGPPLAMFGVLLLTSLVGIGIGLCISATAKTSEVAIALLPLILLPMVILAGILQPLHKMNDVTVAVANLMPSRWAFEGMLLLETDARPEFPREESEPAGTPTPLDEPPPAPLATTDVKPPGAPRLDPKDMAEAFFPRDDHRLGVVTGVAILASTWAALLCAAAVALRLRDIH